MRTSTTAAKPAQIPASTCRMRIYREHGHRFEGAPGVLLGKVLTAQTVGELKALRGELREIEAVRTHGLAAYVIGQEISKRVEHVVPMPTGRVSVALKTYGTRVEAARRAIGR